ncbi:MAG: hypothetical protein PHP98_10300 [Kiritimatiellae bacterium]|nr:hypothetical protein [Kiritimatiellia bacterium]
MKIKAIRFGKLPLHDACWSLITGRDNRIYVGVCGELTGGLSVYLVSYDPKTERTDYLVEVAATVGIPSDNGHATQSKIHYCLLAGDDGLLYGATHCTGAPLGDPIWRPWHCWYNPAKTFDGAKIFCYDPARDKVVFTDTVLSKEGSRCMALNQKAKKLYGISYPKNHFFVYDLASRRTEDFGRIGSINPQAIFLDVQNNAYTTDDYGYLLKFDAQRQKLHQLSVKLPRSPFRDGFHNVLYDAVLSPDGKSVFGVSWNFGAHLFRYDFDEGPEGRICDLGLPYGPDRDYWKNMTSDHAGGLVFGFDKMLYYAVNFYWKEPVETHLIRFHPEKQIREDLGIIAEGNCKANYIARGAADIYGNLYFADAGVRPTKVFKYTPEYAKTDTTRASIDIYRNWG